MTTLVRTWEKTSTERVYAPSHWRLVRLTYFWRYSGWEQGSGEYFSEQHSEEALHEEVFRMLWGGCLPNCEIPPRMGIVLVEAEGFASRILYLPLED